ncbi:hypothetical protein CR513_38397, partial [Mucuna pruriens]
MHSFPSIEDAFSLWHKRLGHFSFSNLKQISSNELANVNMERKTDCHFILNPTSINCSLDSSTELDE